VQADEDDAIDVAGGEVADRPSLVDIVVRHQQDELLITGRQGGADASDQPGEERIVEQPAGRLCDDDRDRVAPAGDEAASGAVRDVAETIDRALDGAPDVGTDLWRAVHHPRHGRSGDTGDAGDLVERRDGSRREGLELRHCGLVTTTS
jgi:hypothetical protein